MAAHGLRHFYHPDLRGVSSIILWLWVVYIKKLGKASIHKYYFMEWRGPEAFGNVWSFHSTIVGGFHWNVCLCYVSYATAVSCGGGFARCCCARLLGVLRHAVHMSACFGFASAYSAQHQGSTFCWMYDITNKMVLLVRCICSNLYYIQKELR